MEEAEASYTIQSRRDLQLLSQWWRERPDCTKNKRPDCSVWVLTSVNDWHLRPVRREMCQTEYRATVTGPTVWAMCCSSEDADFFMHKLRLAPQLMSSNLEASGTWSVSLETACRSHHSYFIQAHCSAAPSEIVLFVYPKFYLKEIHMFCSIVGLTSIPVTWLGELVLPPLTATSRDFLGQQYTTPLACFYRRHPVGCSKSWPGVLSFGVHLHKWSRAVFYAVLPKFWILSEQYEFWRSHFMPILCVFGFFGRFLSILSIVR